jgi:hypothetical protein
VDGASSNLLVIDTIIEPGLERDLNACEGHRPFAGSKGQEETTMNVKRTVALAVALATILVSTLTFAPAASARVNIGIRVDAPPPPLRHEVVITRPGRYHVWVPGHWDWSPRRHAYVWIPGVWVRPRHHHAVWVPPHWEHRGNATFFIRGHWR